MAIAKGKTNASRVQAGDRILVLVTEGGVTFSGTKTGAGVQVARVTGKSTGESVTSWGRPTSRMTYNIHTSAGIIRNLAPIQTMWLAPEDPAGIKRAHVEALKEDQDRDHAEKVRSQLRTATTEALVDALTDAAPSLAALIQEELAFRQAAEELATMTTEELEDQHQSASEARDWAAEERFRLELDRRRQAEKVDPAEEPPTAEEALAAIGECWAGGALTGKALKAYADGDYKLALTLAADQRALQEEGPEEAVHPEERAFRNRPEARTAREPLAQTHGFRDSYSGMVCGAMVERPDGTGDQCGEPVESPVHVQAEAPAPVAQRCQPRDVVTIHRGTDLWEVLEVVPDYSRNGVTGEVTDLTLARISRLTREGPLTLQWVHVDLLHVRQPVARVATEEITQRVRQAREVFTLPDGSLRVVRTIQMDSRRVPLATLVQPPPALAAPVATLRVGEAVVVDGRCLAVQEKDCGHLELVPAPHRDRLKDPVAG